MMMMNDDAFCTIQPSIISSKNPETKSSKSNGAGEQKLRGSFVKQEEHPREERL